MKHVLFFDLETGAAPRRTSTRDKPGGKVGDKTQITDIGAWCNGSTFHGSSLKEFETFAQDVSYTCGHNICRHDLPILKESGMADAFFKKKNIDTLYLSALLFPQNPYHKLVKDYKLVSDEINNPVSDSKLAEQLLKDCVRRFDELDIELKRIYYFLLNTSTPFNGFFSYVGDGEDKRWTRGMGPRAITLLIKRRFSGKLCIHCDFDGLMTSNPLETAFALALLTAGNSGPPTEIMSRLERIEYEPCLALMAVLDGPPDIVLIDEI